MAKEKTRGLRIGLIARADNTGLGTQTWEFYRHMHPTKTLVVDISELNGMENFHERYPDGGISYGFPTDDVVERFLKDLDVVFTCETPYNYKLFEWAPLVGVKTVLQPNWEFLDYHQQENLPFPDLFALPSQWHWEDFFYGKKMFLPVPVDRSRLPLRKPAERARVFLHIAGRPAHEDRNGTQQF